MKNIYKFIKAGMAAASLLLCNLLSAQFSSGNIVVLQAGDGTATYTGNVSSPVILQEFSPAGTPAFSVALPTTTAGITVTGNDVTEGLITRSIDNQFIVIPGYNVASGTPAVQTSAASLAPRGIGSVNPAGSFSLTVTTNTFYSGDAFRSATGDGSGNFWGSGNISGITTYSYSGSTPATTGSTILSTAPSQNERAVAVYNGQLYYSSGSLTKGVFSVGTGTPTTPSAASIIVNNGSSPYQFAFSTSGNTLYIADKTAGVQKWTYSAGTWTNNYTYSTTANSVKAVGLIADFSGSNPIIYATIASGTSLIAITDGGSLTTSTITALATAPVNTTFRGLAFSPVCATTSVTSASGSGCTGSPLALNVTASGTSPLSYSWTGAGTINNANVASPIVTGFSGNYTVTIKNACGVATSTVVIPINSSPTLSPVSSFSACTGSSVILTPTLTPNGAGISYTVNTPLGATSLTAALAAMASAPAGTYPCTLTAQNAVGCISNSQTFTVSLSTTPTLSPISNFTSCSGNAITLTPALSPNTAGTGYTLTTSLGATSLTTALAAMALAPAGIYPCTLTAQSAAGCLSNNQTFTASIAGTPTLSPVNSFSACTGNTISLSPTLSPTATGASFTLTTPIGATSLTTALAALASAPAGTYPCTLTAQSAAGCSSNNQSFTLSLSTTPTLSPISSFTFCTGSAIALTPTINPGSAGATYTLTTPSGAASLTTALAALSSASAGTYTCTLTAQTTAGCLSNTQAFAITVDICTGIISYVELATTIAPNPANESVEISFATSESKTISLVNSLGQTVLTKNTNDTSMRLDVSEFAKGIYFISITSRNQKAVKRLIVQ